MYLYTANQVTNAHTLDTAESICYHNFLFAKLKSVADT